MIVKPLVGTFPDMAITISGAPVDYTSINAVEFLLSENMHDGLSIEMGGIPTRAITDYIDAPVLVNITMSGQTHTFTGNVIDVLPVSTTSGGLVNDSPFQTARLICMGASYEMRDNSSLYLVDYSLRDVVERYVDKYKISADVPQDSIRRGSVVQGTRNDWKFLVDEVTRNGYSMTLHGTHLHIFDPYAALSRTGVIISLITLRKTRMDAAPYPGQILDFRGRFGARNSDGKYKESIVSVLTNGKTFTVSTGDGTSRFKEYPSDYGGTYGEAVKLAEVEKKKAYDYEAQAQVVGVVGIVPGSVVKLDEYDNPQFDGYWYVREVKHRVATGAFLTDLSLARNKEEHLTRDGTLPMRDVPESEFYGGRWVSKRRGVNEY
jgi:hypothetical protein